MDLNNTEITQNEMIFNPETDMFIMDEEASIQNKHLNLSPLNEKNFIKVNEIKEIFDPVFFSRVGTPTPHGLLSNEIFGITKDDRMGIFAYIHLADEYFMHPLAYKQWCRLDSNVKSCAYELENFIFDKKTGKLKADPNGKTGIKYLKELLPTIEFKKNKSSKRNTRIDFLEKYRDKLFIENLIVIPAGYRDVNTESGRIGVGEINKLYNSIIRDCRALKQSEDYGLSLNGSLRGRIQDNIVAIYDWFVFGRYNGQEAQASGLSRKLGLIRRAGMKKSFDWGARLVICTQNLRKENIEDLDIDLDSFGLPLAAVCANFFPFMMYYIRSWFERQFSDTTYMQFYGTKTGEKAYRVERWQETYSDERIKKELDRFMHGSANRFIPIEAPIIQSKSDNKSNPVYLLFKGYPVADQDAIQRTAQGIKERRPDIITRPLTWCDLIYWAALDVTKDKMTLITRFPIDSYWNQYAAKIKVLSTIETERLMINNKLYPTYPKIRISDLNKNSSNKFIDVGIPNNVRLDSIGGDYDGDTVSSKAIYSIEANEELKELIESKRHYIGLGGINEMQTSKEGIQSIYNLTLCLPEDLPKLEKPKFRIPPKYAESYREERKQYESDMKKKHIPESEWYK